MVAVQVVENLKGVEPNTGPFTLEGIIVGRKPLVRASPSSPSKLLVMCAHNHLIEVCVFPRLFRGAQGSTAVDHCDNFIMRFHPLRVYKFTGVYAREVNPNL